MTDTDATLTRYARETAADCGEPLPVVYRLMAAESPEVALATGIPRAEIEAWCREAGRACEVGS